MKQTTKGAANLSGPTVLHPRFLLTELKGRPTQSKDHGGALCN